VVEKSILHLQILINKFSQIDSKCKGTKVCLNSNWNLLCLHRNG